MKKMSIALAIASLLISTDVSANATEDWRKLGETVNGVALLTDVNQFHMGRNDNNLNVIVGRFRFFPGDSPFVYVIIAESCIKGQGEIFRRVFKNNEWVTVDTNWWSTNGGRMFDIAGAHLCAVATEVNKSKNVPEQKNMQSPKSKDNKSWPKSSGTSPTEA